MALSQWIPAIEWMPQYKSWNYLQHDLIAGLTIATIIIPQSLAYASVASLPPVYGLYTSMIPPIIYLFLGTTPYNSIGIMAIMSLLLGEALSVANGLVSPEDLSSSLSLAFLDILIAIFLCFLVGTGQLLIAISGGGNFLTRHVFCNSFVSAFTTGSAVTILTAQIQPFLGLSVPKYNGLYSTPKAWIYVLSHMNAVKGTTIAVGLVSVSLILVVRQIEIGIRRLILRQNATDFTTDNIINLFPEVLFTVVVVTICTTRLGLPTEHGLEIIGHIPSGLPPVSIPWDLINRAPVEISKKIMLRLIPSIISMVLVSTVLLSSIVTAFPTPTLITSKSNQFPDDSMQTTVTAPVNQEIFAFAMASIVASFFSCFSPGAPLARSAVLVNKTNVRSPFGIFFSAVAVALAVSFASTWIANIPKAVLAAVIAVALVPVLGRVKLIQTLTIKAWKDSKDIMKPLPPPIVNSTGMDGSETSILPLDHIMVSSESTDLDTLSEMSTATASDSGSHGVTTKPLLLPSTMNSCGWRKSCYVIKQWYDVIIWLSTILSIIILDVGTAIYIGLGLVIVFKFLDWITGLSSRS